MENIRWHLEGHGELRASSPGLGQGSTFSVRLPLLPARPRPPAKARTEAPVAPVAPASRRVLVVEDNVDSAQSLAAVLGSRGHTVTLAYDGPSALAKAEQQVFDVVILDIGLPGMDGYQVARTLRGRSSSAGLAIVALTGYGQKEDVAMAREAGCDEHLVKPANVETLAALVGRVPWRGG